MIDPKDGQEVQLKAYVTRLRKEHNKDAKTSKMKHIKYAYRGQEQSCYAYCGIHRI